MPRVSSSVKSPIAKQVGRLIARRIIAQAASREIDPTDIEVGPEIELFIKTLMKPDILRNVEIVANEVLSRLDGEVTDGSEEEEEEEEEKDAPEAKKK